MGFLQAYAVPVRPHEFHYKNECNVCPLRFESGADIKPVGSKQPVVYILGEAPGQEEVKARAAFVGPAGNVLRKYIPDNWLPDIRWNNCVRTRPPKNRTPTAIELACCRRSIEEDIALTKPRAIFGFGAIALDWVMQRLGITVWSGRYVPVQIAGHTCWFFPIVHPSYILHIQDAQWQDAVEHIFGKHIERALRLVEELPDPVVHDRDKAFEGVDFDMNCNDRSVERIYTFVQRCYGDHTVGLDYETNAIRPYNKDSKILTIALSGSHGTLAWPVQHSQARWSPNNLRAVEDIFEDFLEKAPCRKVVHHLPFELEWTSIFYGMRYVRMQPWGCSLGQAYILDERQQKLAGGGPMSLGFLTHQHFGIDIKPLSNLDRANLDNCNLDDVLRYNAVDARYHRLLYQRQARLLKAEGLMGVYEEQLRRITTATLTQLKGIPTDPEESLRLHDKFTKLRDAVWKKIAALDVTKEFYQRTGHEYRPSAPQDVHFMLKQILPDKLTRKARDRDGKITSVDEKALANINHPIAKLTVEWKKHAKVLSTYIEPVLPGSKLIYDDGLGHPTLQTAKTRTWRTSADGWNNQNWPKRNEGLREVRKQIAKKGYKVVSLDYSNIQARNVAMESRCEGLVKAFRERYDLHTDWVERIARAHPDWVNEGVKQLARDKALFKKYRDKVKQDFTFASLFGAQPKTVAYYIGAPESVGRKLQDQLWTMFPGVPAWHKGLYAFYEEHGYVTGLSGFRRRGPLTDNEKINAPIQADEAIIVLDAMTRLSEKGWRFQANMEIHDDLTFIWPEDQVDENVRVAVDVMLQVPYEWAHIVPIGVEVAVGDDWYKQAKLGEYFSDTWKGKL